MTPNHPYGSSVPGEQYQYPQDGGTQIMGPPAPQAAPYGAPPAPTAPTAPRSAPSLSGLRIAVVAAFALAVVAIWIGTGGFKTSHAVSSAQFRHMQSQVASLTQQVKTLTSQRNGLSQQVTTLTKTQGQLSDQVKGMGPTVNYVGQFTKSCSLPTGGTFPCKPGG